MSTLSDCYGPRIRPRLCMYRVNTLLLSSTPAQPFYFWKKVITYIWGGANHGTHRAVSSLHPHVGPRDQTRVDRFGGKYTYPMSYLTASPNFISSERRGYKQWVPDWPDLHRKNSATKPKACSLRLHKALHKSSQFPTNCHFCIKNYSNISFKQRFIFCFHITVCCNSQTSISESLETLNSQSCQVSESSHCLYERRLRLVHLWAVWAVTAAAFHWVFISSPVTYSHQRAICLHNVLQPMNSAQCPI